MARFKSKHTKPEMLARRMLHRLGFRFRLHRRDLPGCPDIVLPRYRLAIQVKGCFWHRHEGCPIATTPRKNREFWLEKFERNVARDRTNHAALEAAGWTELTIWECETKDAEALEARLASVLPVRSAPAASHATDRTRARRRTSPKSG